MTNIKVAMSIMIFKIQHYNQIRQYVAHMLNVGAHMNLSMLTNTTNMIKIRS
jgi:hypothetical protein